MDGQQLRLWESRLSGAEVRAQPGSVVKCTPAGIDVATGAGVLRIVRLQLPGKRARTVRDFLNAHSLAGVVFA